MTNPKRPHRFKLLRVLLALGSIPFIATCQTTDDGSRVQGWTAEQMDQWAYASQGSRLMPIKWMRALEQKDSLRPFLDQAHMEGFGFLSAAEGASSDLPVGFAIDVQSDNKLEVTKLRWRDGQKSKEAWVGLNCAACHTGAVEHGGENITIPGAPGMGDFQAFIHALDDALDATVTDDAKFERFATKVLEDDDSPENRDMLREAAGKLNIWQKESARLNETDLDYGYARVDAFGHIYNKVVQFTAIDTPVGNEPNAPVSYPFLWNIWRQDKVQWNGAVENSRLSLGGDKFLDYGALGRNAGEVVGVFGEVIIKPKESGLDVVKGYKSSLQADNLDRLETQLRLLTPPEWPATMNDGQMSEDDRSALVSKGEALFDQKCASCHLPEDKWQDDKPIERMITFRSMVANDKPTDIWMACNAFLYSANTGKLKGTGIGFFNGDPYGDKANIIDMLSTTVKGALIGEKGDLVKTAASIFLGLSRDPKIFPEPEAIGADEIVRQAKAQTCLTEENTLLAYKARPLDGIWATSPYLHNGSVPTLYHLLLPSEDRPRKFWVGSRKFDTKLVGYQWEQPDSVRAFQFVTHDDSGKPIPGNSNEGHEYGAAGFSEEDRQALVEYMKTL